MDFHIRCAQIQDLAQILSIYNAEIRTGTANWNEHEKSLADFQHWFNALQLQQFPLFVAEDQISKKLWAMPITQLFGPLLAFSTVLNILFLFIQILSAKV